MSVTDLRKDASMLPRSPFSHAFMPSRNERSALASRSAEIDIARTTSRSVNPFRLRYKGYGLIIKSYGEEKVLKVETKNPLPEPARLTSTSSLKTLASGLIFNFLSLLNLFMSSLHV